MFAKATSAAAVLLTVAMLMGWALAQGPETSSAPAANAPAATAPASGPASRPTVTFAPAGEPASDVKADAGDIAPATAPADAPIVRFQFEGENLRDVVGFISRLAGKPIMGDVKQIQGTLTYFDSKPYTVAEAISIVNQALRQNGYTLMENPNGRRLDLVNLKDPSAYELPLIVSGPPGQPGNLDEPRRADDEMVTVIQPLQWMEPAQAVGLAVRMVHKYGQLAALDKAKGIIITDTVANIRRIQRLITALDKGSLAKQQLMYYQLKFAPAADVAQLIEKVFGRPAGVGGGQNRFTFNQQTGQYELAPQADASESVSVSFDARCNLVAVLAAPDKHEMIKEMIAQLDVDQPIGEGSAKIIRLKNAKAADLAKILTEAVVTNKVVAVPGRGGGVRQVQTARVVADPASNILIISGQPDIVQQMEKMITELDGAVPDQTAPGLRLFPLKTASALAVAPIIQNAFAVRGPQVKPADMVTVTPDSRTNTLIVRGPASELEGVSHLLEQLDKPLTEEQSGGAEIHVVRLTTGDAKQLADALRKLLAPPPATPGSAAQPKETVRVEADSGTNSLIIGAAPGDWQRIQGVLSQLTKEAPGVTVATQIFQLKYANPAELAPSIQRLMEPRAKQPHPPGTPPAIPAVLSYDVQSRAILASATGDDLKEIQRLITTLDTPTANTPAVQVKTYAITTANAVELAKALDRLFAANAPKGPRPTGAPADIQPKFEAESMSNQLIVSATADQFKVIESLMGQWQQQASFAKSSVRLFQLKNARADQLVEPIRKTVEAEVAAFDRNTGKPGGKRTDFQVSGDARSNTLLVTAPGETISTIEKLLTVLDSEDLKQAQQIKIMELVNADPVEVADALNAALVGQQPRGPAAQGINMSNLAARRVMVVPAKSARAVLLSGAGEDIAEAETLIKQIDARPSNITPVVKTFPLKYAKAENLAKVLSETVGQPPAAGPGRTGISSKISADTNANALVVSAAGDVVERVAELLKQLDVEGATAEATTIQIVPLKSARAETLAMALNSAQNLNRPMMMPPGQAKNPSEDVVRVTADPPSNSLLLSGRPAMIEQTKKLILQLDGATTDTVSQTKIFALTKAKASEVAAVLEKILVKSPAKPGMPAGQWGAGAAAPAAAEVRIAAQDQANSVVVQGPVETLALAEQIIKDFDSSGSETTIQIVKLQKAEAASLADAINLALAEQGAKPVPGQPAKSGVTAFVVAESNSNSLLVRGPKLEVERALTMIAQLDQGEGAYGKPQVRTFQLKKAEAGVLAKTLDVLFKQMQSGMARSGRPGASAAPPPVSVAADERTNKLVISASTGQFVMLEELIKTLDNESEVAMRSIQYVPVLHSDPAALAKQIDAMFADRPKGERPVVQADELSGGLSVVAKDIDFKAIELVVSKADDAAEANSVLIRVLPVSPQVRAEKLAPMLKQLYEQVSNTPVSISDKLPPREPVGTIILPAPREPGTFSDVDKTPTTTSAPASQPATSGARVTLDIKPRESAPQAPAVAAEPTTQPVPGAVPIMIAVDKATNSLIVSGSRKDVASIEDLVTRLASGAVAAEYELKVFKLKTADPTSVARILDSIFNPRVMGMFPANMAGMAAQPGGRGAQNPQAAAAAAANASRISVTIAADPRTRSVVVRGKPQDIDVLEPLIQALDTTSTVVSEVRIFPLKNVDATEVASNLRELFAPVSAPSQPGMQGMMQVPGMPGVMMGGGRNQEQITRMLQLRRAGGVVSEVDPSSGVTITANRMTNSVIVVAPADALELAAKLVEEMDQSPAGGGTAVKMFPIKHAEVADVVDAVRQIFANRPRMASAGGGGRGMGAGAGGAMVGGNATALVAGNESAKTVIVSARVDEMPLIEQVIQELDSTSLAETLVKVYPLTQGDARTVADALKATLTGGAAGAAAGGGRGMRAGGGTGASSSTDPRISAEVGSNSIVVRASQTDHERISALIKELDIPAAQQAAFKTVQLVRSDAREVAQSLTQMLRSTPVRKGEPVPSVTADRITNKLMLSGSAKDIERLTKMVTELEEGAQERAQLQLIPLKNARAIEVATALSVFYGAKSSSSDPADRLVTVTADDRTNHLLVSARPEKFADITALINKLDESGAEKQSVVKVYPLQMGDARSVADALKGTLAMNAAGGAGAGGGGRGQRGGPGAGAAAAAQDVFVAAEAGSNAIVVKAPQEVQEQVAKLVVELDKTPAQGESQRVVIALAHAQADSVAKAINESFAPPRGSNVKPSAADTVIASAESGTNSVVISGSAKSIEKIQALIKQLDTETTGGRTIEFVMLANAKAVEVAKVLSTVSARKQLPKGEEAPAVSAEPSSNALVIAGKKSDIELLMGMAKQLDQAITGKGQEVRILPVKNAYASNVADVANKVFQAQANAARAQGRTPDTVAIAADDRSNTLVVSANEEQFKVVTQLVNQIDEITPTKGNVRLIQLKNVNPDEVIKALNQIYGGQADPVVGRGVGGGRPAMGRAGGPNVSVLPEQRSLLVNASDQDWEAIQKIIATLEEAAAGTKREVQVFALTKAPNVQVANALNNVFRPAERPNHPEDRVTAAPLAGTNSVVVTASKEKILEVAKLIKELDGESIAGAPTIKRFPLINASAVKMAPMLQQMVAPLQQSRPGQPINISVDAGNNSIMVSTQAPVWEDIERIIKILDEVPAFKTADILIIPLKNADAPALAAVLTDMLTPATTRELTPEAKALQEQIRLLRLKQGKEGLGLDLTKPIKITSDPATRGGGGAAGAAASGSNSLIISSTPENLAAMVDLVALLDTLPIASGVKLQIMHLKNSDALAAAAMLKEVFTQGKALAGRPGTPTAGKAQPESLVGQALTNTLSVTADARTNALILAGSEESLALAVLIVNDVDRQPASEFTEVKLYKLENGDAVKIAPLIRQAFAEQAAGAAGAGGAAAGAAGARAYVTRLRMLRDKEMPVATEIARTHPTMIVEAEANANILIVVARSDLIPVVTEMVKTLDVPGAGSMNAVRIYPLSNADAARIQTVINGLYTGSNAQLIRPEDKPSITVDIRTNSLIVNSSEKTFTMIDLLLAKLDAKLPIDLRDIRLIGPFDNADATTLAASLQKMMDARVQRQASLGAKDAESLRVIITPDPRTNMLIVGGTAEGSKLVEDLAKQLDKMPAALSGQVQIIPLENANAGTLAQNLASLFDQRYSRRPELGKYRPVIMADLRTNSILIAAEQDDSQALKTLIAKLDGKPMNPAVELVVIPLKYNDSGSVGPVIQKIFTDRLRQTTLPGAVAAPQDQVSVSVEPMTNSLVVSASKDNLQMIRDLIAKVDLEPPSDTGVVKMYPLQYTDVSRVMSLLQQLVQQGLYKPALVDMQSSAIMKAREKISFSSDIRTNTLIVSASKENFAVIEQILKGVDTKDAWGLSGNCKIYVLKYADANKLGPILQQTFDKKRQAEAATGGQPRSLPVVISIDPRTNALIVAASVESFNDIEALLSKLDVSDIERTFDFQVFWLKHASATPLQSTIQKLFAQRVQRGGPNNPVTVIADPRMNSLIVGGDKDDMEVAKGLIERLDKAQTPNDETVRVFPVVRGDAVQLAKTLQSLYDSQKPTGGASGIAVTVDERSNSLIVAAGKNDMDSVGDMIAKLDTAAMATASEIRIFTLRHADAQQLATILTDALTNKPKPMTPVSPNRATVLQFLSTGLDGKKLMASALKEDVMVTAVPKTNSLLVQAPLDTMPLLARLIDAIDNTAPPTAEIRVLPLVNADATTMAKVLADLFKLQVAGGAGAGPGGANVKEARYTLATSQPSAGDPPASVTIGSAEASLLTITVDRRTNSLLVGGTVEYVELVQKVITELDSSPALERQQVVYRLRNAKAADIATALRTFLDQEKQRISSMLGADATGAAKEMLARDISIVAEPASNRLLISGSPRFFKTIAAMVDEMDQPPPQVLIQVLLAEVTLDDSTELGMDWNFTGHPKKGPVIGGGTNFGVSAAAGNQNGFNFSISSGDFTMMLQALQSQGRLEVLSRPQILASDNMVAKINVGQRVPFVSSSNVNSTGGIYNTISYDDVGIILQVTPHISPDGYVKMEVSPTVSSIADSSVKISNDLNAIIINSRSVSTVATVQDGHTIVIGGLITSKEQNTEDKVPWLGNLAWIGAAFKNTKTTHQRTELLIILTPRVIRTSTDGDVISNKHVRELGLSKGIHNDHSIGELLNPLRDIPAAEVKRVEDADPDGRPRPPGAVWVPRLTPGDSVDPANQPTWPGAKAPD